VPKGDQWFKWNKLNNFIYFSPFQLNDANIAKYLNQMIQMNVTILRGYPSSVATIADFVKRTNHPIPTFKFILVASEVLTDSDRNLVQTYLRAPVTNHYGLADVCVMMGDCEKHEGLHNYDEYSRLELLDTENPLEKRIVGTHLHNLATPLIRYETGDIAELAEKPCSCGKTLPTIKNIGGRKDVKLRTPEGYEVPTVNFYTMFETFQDVSRWQIVQHRLDFIEFIVKTPHLAPERIEKLRHDIYERLPQSIEIKISINKDFVQKGEGKINTVMSFLK
jgi:phenylacetate-CoA ligase